MPVARTRSVLAAALAAAACLAAPAPAHATDLDACIDANEKGIALRKQGALREALGVLVRCADPSCPAEITTACRALMKSVSDALPTLVLGAKDGAGNDLYAVAVTMDGAPFTASLDGRPLPVDPGKHEFRFGASGAPALVKVLVLREGEKDRRETVVLGPPAAPAPPAPAVPPPSSWSAAKTAAVVMAGAGVAGFAVGSVFGGYAVAAKNDEARDCKAPGCAGHAQASADYSAAHQDAAGATVGFVAGGALVAGGIVAWLLAPSSSASRALAVAPSVGASGGGLVVSGRW